MADEGLSKTEINEKLNSMFTYEKPEPSKRLERLDVVNEETMKEAGLYNQWKNNDYAQSSGQSMEDWYESWYSNYIYESSSDSYMSEQMDASSLGPIKDYYNDPSPETILVLKGKFVNGAAFPGGIFGTYNQRTIKKLLESVPAEVGSYKDLQLMQKIINTPDELFRKVLDNSDSLKEAARKAPYNDNPLHKDPFMFWHYKSLCFEGDTEKYIGNWKKLILEHQQHMIDYAKELGEGGLAAFMQRNPVDDVGEVEYHIEYLDTKGLDGLSEICKRHLRSYKKTDDGYELRFFVHTNRDSLMSNDEQPGSYTDKQVRYFQDAMIENGLTVSMKDPENLRPIKTKSLAGAIKILENGGPAYNESEFAFPWEDGGPWDSKNMFWVEPDVLAKKMGFVWEE